MTDNRIVIKPMTDFDGDIRYNAAAVFVDAYYKELSFFNKDKEKLKAAFQTSFCPEVFYLAVMDDEVVGILACSNNHQRAMNIEKSSLRKGLGFIVGSLAYYAIKNEFNISLPYPDNAGYIECVATTEKARGKGVCTALAQYVMQELPYRQYILEVVDTNQTAYRLYKKLGFVEFERKPEKHSKAKGFNERIYMKWCK